MIHFESRDDRRERAFRIGQVLKVTRKWYLAIIAVSLLACSVSLLRAHNTFDYISSVLWGVLAVPCALMFMFTRSTKKRVLCQPVNEHFKCSWRFSENKIVVTETDEDYFCEVDSNYTYYHSVQEKHDHFLFFVHGKFANILFKDTLKEGSVDHLRQLLKKNLGTKFVPEVEGGKNDGNQI